MVDQMYSTSVVHVEKSNVSPLDQRTKLMFTDILSSEQTSYFFMYEPDEMFREKSENYRRMSRRMAREKLSKNKVVFVQTQTRSLGFADSEVILTEELVELLTILYFRAQGYMVQRPLNKTYNGVDDVVVWKSRFTEKLREHRFIDYGCYVPELKFLRQWGKPKQAKREQVLNDEFALVEAESCFYNAVKNDGGMNQLIGREWNESTPQNYREGARKLSVANRLFITFPVYLPCRFPEAKCFEDIVSEFHRRQGGREKVGVICWELDRLHTEDSGSFEPENMAEEIKQYDSHVKLLLLENFYFNELLALSDKLGIDFSFKSKTLSEVCDELKADELQTKIQHIDVDKLLLELDKVLNSQGHA